LRTNRLDVELVRRGLTSSRTEARRAIDEGKVEVRGMPATRSATLVSYDDPIAFKTDAPRFVSRGGDKLDGALETLDVRVEGKKWLDVGASTGGFTDRLLQGGATSVCALDVGYGQLDWRLRNDDRVVVMERTNARYLSSEDLPWRPEGIVADVSFISLALVLPALVRSATREADFVLLVKPQFEVGRAAVRPGGVVRDPALWRSSIDNVVSAGKALGLGLAGVVASTLPGPAGNREFFVHLRAGAAGADDAVGRAVAAASG
jgi:23S rRNA (cytidine1920-2'-O)/16S rRNA (cytidine1409-2'-O)-methyltransferase